ncbi:polysaccharide biosynthesis tyrosine autokinase [Actinomyces naeslundii]|uniref:Polysaccharide biosynthesis tyrosine autokinase n=1 Tax=Actinomyces naeslundii TaxID=1655 RepID=A0AA47IPZ8_ACTNA|nr:polysaccharide biosynthesis tyrosine autokinase [Actinomyces naeslundii]WAL43385.1 polysaccharide biosynthesis tyrosine autokinase [Actinomyces naeslundii]
MKVAGDPAQSTLSQYNAAQLAAMKSDAVVPVFTSAAVAQRVVDSLKLDETAEEFASSVSATRVPETVSVQVSATAYSSHRAQVLADEVVRQAAAEIKDLEGEDSPVEIVLLSSAELVSATRSPALVTCVAVGLLAGLVLGYVWILVQELLDKSLRGPEEVREALSVPLLGALPRVPSLRWLSRGAELKMEEQLRVARTNVLHALSQGGRRVVVVTSAGPQEGTSVTAASLARVLALSGHRVVLVGGDLRAPGTAGLQGSPGLADVLTGSAYLGEALVKGSVEGLELLPAGRMPANPSELLGAPMMRDLLRELAADRLVIIDAPPVLRFTDGVVLAARAGGVILVARAGRTSAEDLHEAALAIEQGGGRMLGVVLNNVSELAGKRKSLRSGVVSAESVPV